MTAVTDLTSLLERQALQMLTRVAVRVADDYASLGLVHTLMQTIRNPWDGLAKTELNGWRKK
jgi:hypothetical protein